MLHSKHAVKRELANAHVTDDKRRDTLRSMNERIGYLHRDRVMAAAAAKGVAQSRDLAQALGVSESNLSRWLSAKELRAPSALALAEICRFLDEEPGYLLGLKRLPRDEIASLLRALAPAELQRVRDFIAGIRPVDQSQPGQGPPPAPALHPDPAVQAQLAAIKQPPSTPVAPAVRPNASLPEPAGASPKHRDRSKRAPKPH